MLDDEDALEALLAVIEKGHDADKRVAAINSLAQQLDAHFYGEHHDAIDHAFKAALKSANASVLFSALSTLPTLTRHLAPSHAVSLKRHILALLPTTLDRLGDHNKRAREAAREAVAVMGHVAFQSAGPATAAHKGKEAETPLAIFERLFRDGALMAKSPKVKEPALAVLVSLREADDKFPLRPFLPASVELLSDADAGVRDAARKSIVTLFSRASPNAKSDLRREMEKQSVRKQTVEAVMAGVGAGASSVVSPPATPLEAESSRAAPTVRRAAPPMASDAEASGSGNGRAEVAPASRSDDVAPVWVSSRSELDRLFSSMHPHFVGRESEHNWLAREEDVIKIKGLLKSEAHGKFPDAFVVGLRGVVDGILKGAASLRTTLAIHSITLVGDLATALGDDLEPLADQLLTAMLKMAGFTKKMVANASQASAKSILTNLSYRHNFLHAVVPGLQDKNVSMRLAMCLHLCTILDAHAEHRKHLVEGHDGLNMLVDALKRTLPDSNKDVRAAAREAYFKFQRIWPGEAAALLNTLEAAIQKQVHVAAAARPGVAATSSAAAVPSAAVKTATKAAASGVARRPGGPSAAILAAKRAAAEKLARERAAEAEAEEEAARAREEEAANAAPDDEAARDDAAEQDEQEPAEPEPATQEPDEQAQPERDPMPVEAAEEQHVPAEEQHAAAAEEQPHADPQEQRLSPAAPTSESNAAPPSGAALPPISARPISPSKPQAGSEWFSRQAERLSAVDAASSPRKKRPEVDDWLRALGDGSADLKTFRRLAKLSSDFRIEGAGEGAIAGWTEGNLFDRLWESLVGFVASTEGGSSSELTTAALVVLQKLVENQFTLIASTQREEELLRFVLGLRRRRSRTAWSACEAILDSWCARTDAILGLAALTSTLREEQRRGGDAASPSDSAALVLAPGLRCFAKVMLKLPSELLEDEIGHCKDLIKSALQHPNVDLRQAAVAVLVACHRGLGDQGALLQLLQPLETAQMDLLSYYFSKSGVGASGERLG